MCVCVGGGLIRDLLCGITADEGIMPDKGEIRRFK